MALHLLVYPFVLVRLGLPIITHMAKMPLFGNDNNFPL